MFGNGLGQIGAAIGKSFGGGIFTTIGRFAGNWLGSVLCGEDEIIREYFRVGRTIDNSFPSSDIYGMPIPKIYGKFRVSGRLIWSKNIKQKSVASQKTKHYSSSTAIYNRVDYEYFGNFALALCEGPVDQILRVWYKDKIIDLGKYNYRFYKGDESQIPDQILKAEYDDMAPAFRGICYIIFENLPLAEFNNKIPELSFELIRKTAADKEYVGDLVTGICFGPAHGEFLYDTEIIHKRQIYEGRLVGEVAVNSNNPEKLPDSIYSLNQLKFSYPNVKWINIPIAWFTDNLDIAKAEIYPTVEFNNSDTTTSSEWVCEKYLRSNAKIISKDKYNRPNYKGTISDNSLRKYLSFLKSQNFKIILTPQILVDLPDNPSISDLTGDPRFVDEFFRKTKGYNNFITHYAKICRGLVDGFMIGSSLKSLTNIRNSSSSFPAIDNLIALARNVKEILGDRVIISYAADYKEYHSSNERWYNLDPLWSSDFIDVIAINNFFPLTDKDSVISDDDIKSGFTSGNGWEYSYDQEGNKVVISPQYAWKNIKWWWENHHINPNGYKTSWNPKSKKIWFTEFGIPSVDKATNQNDIKCDPKFAPNLLPKYSNGSVDFDIQKRAIKLFIDFWSKEEYVENYFLYNWDIRPYPAWPFMKLWDDGRFWAKSHSINFKFSFSSVNSILEEICRNKLPSSSYVNNLSSALSSGLSSEFDIDGILLNKNYSYMQVISMLRCVYFFDIFEDSNGKIIFKSRQSSDFKFIDSDEFLMIDEYKFYEENHISDFEKISKVAATYADLLSEYKLSYKFSSSDTQLSSKAYNLIRLPFLLSENSSSNICTKILDNIKSEKVVYKFKLPFSYIHLEPGNIIQFNLSKLVTARITNMNFDENFINFIAVTHKLENPNLVIDPG